MGNQKFLLCIGEAAVDFIASERNVSVNEAHNFSRYIGGEAHLAIKVKDNGKNVRLLSKVGLDKFGEYIEKILRLNEVDTSSLIYDSERDTTVSLTTLKENKEVCERVYLNAGADLNLQEKDIGLRIFDNVDMLHLSSYVLGGDYHCLRSVLIWSVKKRIPIFFFLEECFKLKGRQKEVGLILNSCHCLFLNQKHLPLLTGLVGKTFAIEYLWKQYHNLEQIIIFNGNSVGLYLRSGNYYETELNEGCENFVAKYLAYFDKEENALIYFERAVEA